MNLSKYMGAFVVGLIILGVGIFLHNQSEGLKKRCTEPTKGVVVEIVEDDTGDDTTTYYPVIEYTANGTTVSNEYHVGTGSSTEYSVGATYDILYNPDNVNEYIIAGDNSTGFIAMMFIVIGAIVLAVCVIRFIVAIIFAIIHRQ